MSESKNSDSRALAEDRVVHCWEDGPSICKVCGREVEYACLDHPEGSTVGSSCMELQGHSGPHEFARDDEIMVTFVEDAR